MLIVTGVSRSSALHLSCVLPVVHVQFVADSQLVILVANPTTPFAPPVGDVSLVDVTVRTERCLQPGPMTKPLKPLCCAASVGLEDLYALYRADVLCASADVRDAVQ